MPRKPKAQIKKSADGQYYFVIIGANGKVQATSETYTRRFDAERGLYDLFATSLQIMWDRRILIDQLEAGNLLEKLNNSL